MQRRVLIFDFEIADEFDELGRPAHLFQHFHHGGLHRRIGFQSMSLSRLKASMAMAVRSESSGGEVSTADDKFGAAQENVRR